MAAVLTAYMPPQYASRDPPLPRQCFPQSTVDAADCALVFAQTDAGLVQLHQPHADSGDLCYACSAQDMHAVQASK